jgi:hypothetical protein
MIHVVEEIKLLLLLGNGLKHIRGNVRYLVTWNVKVFTAGYSTELLVRGCKVCRSADEWVMYRQGAYKLSAKLGTHITIRLG